VLRVEAHCHAATKIEQATCDYFGIARALAVKPGDESGKGFARVSLPDRNPSTQKPLNAATRFVWEPRMSS